MTGTTDFVLELLCEEIPARMQLDAAENFRALFLKTLDNFGIFYRDATSYVTPRRLVIHVEKIPVRQEDRKEERKGPRVGSPEKAIEGFLNSVGLKSVEECQIQKTPKGSFYFATKFIKGQNTDFLIPEILKEVIEKFPWPKSMRWGRNSVSWVRPIQSVFCIFNDSPVSGRLDLGFDGISFKDSTVGHRFLSQEPFTAHDFETYKQRLQDHFVILDQNERQKEIEEQITKLAAAKKFKVRDDRNLLKEVTGLVEWPKAFIGKIEEEFMQLPEEVLITSMRVHQKYFAVENSQGKLENFFIVVSNIEPKDNGEALLEGNERVLRARLSDAKFFYEQDQKTPLSQHAEKLAQLVFHADLGTMDKKVERLKDLSSYIANLVNEDKEKVVEAASLAKADLCTEMVKEFPELQGIMGYYYALLGGHSQEIAEAISDHYKPKGSKDDLPRSRTGMVLALADRIDTIVGMFAIGIKPTGSKDPYALRRAALGAIQLLENLGDIQIEELLTESYGLYSSQFVKSEHKIETLGNLTDEIRSFFLDRLKVHWKEQGLRHDYITAVFSVSSNEPLSVIGARVHALNDFLSQVEGEHLLAAYRRATNIVRIEEKKDNVVFDHNVNPDLLKEEPEITLFKELNQSLSSIKEAIQKQHYKEAMGYVADLRPHIDEFFEKVTVNVAEASLRANRLRLLSLIRDTLHMVADFSKIEG